MKNKDEIFELVETLKNLFIQNSDTLVYNQGTQDKVNDLLDKLGELTGTFETTFHREKRNIKKELSYINEKGEKIELIDDIEQRIRDVNKLNNNYSCLKSLALINKIAHIYDRKLRSCRDNFTYYCNIALENSTNENKGITFIGSVEKQFPKLVEKAKYDFQEVIDDGFETAFNILFGDENKNPSKNIKKRALKGLKINFNQNNQTNDEEIDKKFEELKKDKECIAASYAKKKYEEGEDIVKFENIMFAVKDYYTSMIGQLLCNNTLNASYELVKTPGAKEGFEYMLIIDDKDLAYYIEVHMPNFIAYELMATYGIKLSSERHFKPLGAAAVYYRNPLLSISDEDKKNGKIADSVRLQTIFRNGLLGNDNSTDDYRFTTSKILKDTEIKMRIATLEQEQEKMQLIIRSSGNPATKEENDSLNEISEKINSLKNTLLKREIIVLEQEQHEIWHEVINSGNIISEEKEARFKEINEKLERLINALQSKKIIALEQKRQEIWRRAMSSGDTATEEEVNLLNEITKELEFEKNALQSKVLENQIQLQIIVLKREQHEIWRRVMVSEDVATKEEETRFKEINKELSESEKCLMSYMPELGESYSNDNTLEQKTIKRR